ncbi:hypothetical protein RF11_07613 [Thelohanellus kitauei]|uniref:Uncharacterized protein n=1 Tax=Thelohanellus kitauei TaxID=669202 RepID=A0A0C2MTL5_THEKT|nr:hypothetical protein RF11_07613 [Thelohanellus kitauei]
MMDIGYNIDDDHYVCIFPYNIVIQDISATSSNSFLNSEFYVFVSEYPFYMLIKNITEKYLMVERPGPTDLIHEQGGNETMEIVEIMVLINKLNVKEPPPVAKTPFKKGHSTSSTDRRKNELTNTTPWTIIPEHTTNEKYSTQRSSSPTIKYGESTENSTQKIGSSSHETSNNTDASVHISHSNTLRGSEHIQSSTQPTTSSSLKHSESTEAKTKPSRILLPKSDERTETITHTSQSTTLSERVNINTLQQSQKQQAARLHGEHPQILQPSSQESHRQHPAKAQLLQHIHHEAPPLERVSI